MREPQTSGKKAHAPMERATFGLSGGVGTLQRCGSGS